MKDKSIFGQMFGPGGVFEQAFGSEKKPDRAKGRTENRSSSSSSQETVHTWKEGSFILEALVRDERVVLRFFREEKRLFSVGLTEPLRLWLIKTLIAMGPVTGEVPVTATPESPYTGKDE